MVQDRYNIVNGYLQAASTANSDEEGSADPFLSDALHVTSTLSLQEYFAAKMASRKSSSNNMLADMGSDTPSPDPDTTAGTYPKVVTYLLLILIQLQVRTLK